MMHLHRMNFIKKRSLTQKNILIPEPQKDYKRLSYTGLTCQKKQTA